jgi:CheY-like chemotaxis protein
VLSAHLIQSPYAILLVEDDAADAVLIREALRDHTAARRIVTQAEDGLAALERLRDPACRRPDLIVLDLNMPRMNGVEVLEVLKSDEDLKSIPVVVLTTSSAPEDIRSAYDLHANAYVTKPVSLDEFVSTVRTIDAFFLETAAVVPLSESR